jgi:hypothetical protein
MEDKVFYPGVPGIMVDEDARRIGSCRIGRGARRVVQGGRLIKVLQPLSGSDEASHQHKGDRPQGETSSNHADEEESEPVPGRGVGDR